MKYSAQGTSLIFALISILIVTVSCEKPVNSIEFDPPPLPDGEHTLTVNTSDINGIPISDYELEITGAFNFSETLSQPVYSRVLTQDGLYTIRIKKDGFIESEINVNTQFPSSPSDEQTYSSTIYLIPEESFHTVNNQNGGVFTFSPGFYIGIEDIPITVTIPQNAIPGSGSTNVRLTRIMENEFDHPSVRTSSGAFGQDIIRMEPNGLRLNSPAILNIPMNVPTPIIDENFELYLYEVTRNSTTGKYHYTDNKIPVEVTPDGTMGTVELDKFATYRIVPNFEVTRSDEKSEFKEIKLGECGDPVTVEFENSTKNIRGMLRYLTPVLQNNAENPASKKRTYNGLEGTAIRVLVSSLIKTYTVKSQATGITIDEVSVESSPIQFKIERVTCFD